ncbi:MAG: hypothetical protein COV72_00530 [Candidatus Omnitrophica bacterium CG11_big_fil_rev_8_21_14_0_20_42_13]|uniref:4Fe-4S ferredoxin-type domain-containing protein n=1 Tax=Candidatus Ghiorseimicrobium undicola TaxID=1974746 RepID=A0A2H0M2H5_9BACT|nr:MAG: hypothetical protein COV72_00530 [Candidatus Omnitrophica bacterium CG11_big_fil_rev_8_21_14_0_20_42_13]
MKSDVYFIEAKESRLQARYAALLKLINKISGLLPYQENEFIPLKITIGDSRCIYNINPEFIKPLVRLIKNTKGAKPFLFDTNVIYHGERQNAVDHLNLVQSKGFGITRTGAPYIVADGLLGQDGKEFTINSKYISKIRVPSFVGMLDNLLVISHATGHILTGFASSIKNVAMGMVCRSTKLAQHSSIRPHIIKEKCTKCGLCVQACPVEAISDKSYKAVIDTDKCVGCGECLCACRFDAIFIHWEDDDDLFARRLIDTAKFVISKFKHKFFINFAFDITKECDCISTKTEKMVASNIGILASSDILSLDKATLDLIMKSSPHFIKERPSGVYSKMFEYAREAKLGNIEYNLIKL